MHPFSFSFLLNDIDDADNSIDYCDYLSQMEFLDVLHPIPTLNFTHYWSYDHLINYHSWNFTYTVLYNYWQEIISEILLLVLVVVGGLTFKMKFENFHPEGPTLRKIYFSYIKIQASAGALCCGVSPLLFVFFIYIHFLKDSLPYLFFLSSFIILFIIFIYSFRMAIFFKSPTVKISNL